MKILIVFGSTSDEAVYKPLTEKLAIDFDVEYATISAHRNLEELQTKISNWKGDAIVAGAGLAAALPGVVAAMTKIPVFGIPVAAQFGGMDALCSIAQMPPGIPVLTSGPDNIDAITSFLKGFKEYKAQNKNNIHFVTSSPNASADIKKAEKLAAEHSIKITSSSEKDKNSFNVYLVTKPEDIHTDEYCLHIPFFPKEDLSRAENYLTILSWTEKGGLWLGANNTRNAVHAAMRLWDDTTTLPNIIHEGSVKNIRGTKDVSPYIFEFSDRYSIFDWGQMPDLIKDKGANLSFMSQFFFDFLGNPKNWQDWEAPETFSSNPILKEFQKFGAKHHGLKPLEGHPRCITVKPVKVINPESSTTDGKLNWDYSAYKNKPENALVPLEVIFRFGVPEGSSLLKRVGDANYCQEIGLRKTPNPGDIFDTPIIEFSTKLENLDRYLTYTEAAEIAGLSKKEIQNLIDFTQITALRLKDCFSGIKLNLWDGKLEFAFAEKDGTGERQFMLVDSIGPDELKLIKDDVHFSKQALRRAYYDTEWYSNVEKAKEIANSRGEKNWKKICIEELKSSPPPLDDTVKKQAEMLYKSISKALSEKYTKHTIYPDAWDIDDVVKSFKPEKRDAA